MSSYNGDAITLKPGTLDDTSWLNPSKMLWMKSAQKWVPSPNKIDTVECQ